MREQVLGLDLRAKKVTAGARRNASARRLLCRRGRTQVCSPELALAMRPCRSRLSHAVRLYSARPGRTAGKRAEPILVYELGASRSGLGTPDASSKPPGLGRSTADWVRSPAAALRLAAAPRLPAGSAPAPRLD